MKSSSRSQLSLRHRGILAVSVVAVALLAMPVAGAAERDGAFRRTSLDGSGRAVMQNETLPARIARVAVRPGSNGSPRCE